MFTEQELYTAIDVIGHFDNTDKTYKSRQAIREEIDSLESPGRLVIIPGDLHPVKLELTPEQKEAFDEELKLWRDCPEDKKRACFEGAHYAHDGMCKCGVRKHHYIDCVVNHMIGGNDIDLVEAWIKKQGYNKWIFKGGGECKVCHRAEMTEVNADNICF
jgi:hypothetical protein